MQRQHLRHRSGRSLLAAFAASTAFGAHARAAFTMSWSTIDGGGARVAGGPYALHGTVGQPDASEPGAAGQYVNTPGYWAAPPPP